MANGLTISCWVEDTNPTTVNLTGNKNMLIRHHSTAKASMYAPDGSALDLDMSYIKNGGKTVWGVEGTFPNVVSNVFDFAAMDSELRSATNTVEVQMVEYVMLTCNAKDSRPDGEGKVTLSCSGNYFNGDFGNYKNTIEAVCRYKKTSELTWSNDIPMSVTVLGNSYSASVNLNALDYTASYDFQFAVHDRLMAVTGSSLNVTSKPIFHWGESDVAFEVPVSFNAGVESLKVNDEITVGSANRIYDNGGILTVFSLATDFRGGVMQYGKSVSFAEYGTWEPQLTCPGVYWSRNGWYIKSGNVVTVGFHIKMTCDSGYNNYNVIITGLPFIPAIAAAGGGMCSGAYVSGGFNFLSFVAETSGNITTRVQSCNHTAAGNLATSASGCWYPSGNGDITLSGTITYMTA